MPELPDVETMRRYLQATSLHQEIEDVEVDGGQLVEHTSEELKEQLVGRSFVSTRRHGKWMFAELDGNGDAFLVLHFGMTGGLKHFRDMEEAPEYERVRFQFTNGYHLAYYAMRKLGDVEVVEDVGQFLHEKELGPDALDPDLDLAAFKGVIEGRRAMAKALLMDQHIIAGIGNVYSDEMLFQAGIYPRRKINDLEEPTLEKLFHTMKHVLQTAIERQAKPERFPDSFVTPNRHEGGRCPKCGAELERVKVCSRTAYYCPNRQRTRVG